MARQRNPSTLNVDNLSKLNLGDRRAHDRMNETMVSAEIIHGATNINCKPALDGLWATLLNNTPQKQLQNYIENTPKVISKSVSPIIKKKVNQYENSSANSTRSLKILYNGGLISKSKYIDIRAASTIESKKSTDNQKQVRGSVQFMPGIPIPRILPYQKVIKFINSLDIGELHDMSIFCTDLHSDDQVIGKFRNVEDLLIRIARMYLYIDQNYHKNNDPLLDWFGGRVGEFKVAIGADGAPFGKESEATSWLVSFLNVKSRVACCNDNFLLCGANCKEDCIAMVRYATDLMDHISLIESKLYTDVVKDINISFKFELVPSDMKWLAFYAGELNNASHYFSTFANVNSDNKDLVGGSVGYNESHTWQPWDYSHRLKVADKISDLKTELENTKLAKSTKRNKVLGKIKEEKSRQERVPIIGKLVNKALAEPLHNTNNAWQYFNKQLMTLALDASNIPKATQAIDELPEGCPFLLYLNAIKSEVKCNLLYLKVKRWFQSGRSVPFDYRFTGKESKLFCHNFMLLISCLQLAVQQPSVSFALKIHALAYLGLNLRDAVSLYTRQSITPDDLTELKVKCTHFFNTCSMFLLSVTPTVWTIGYVIPFHTQITMEKFNCGLGINTMQGREAKHVKVKKYAEHSLPANRWDLVFRHEFISTLYLREQDPHAAMYKSKPVSYIPDRIKCADFCYCGHPKYPEQEQCFLCCHPVRLAISRSCESGKVDPLVCQLLGTSE